jgi:TRAP-type uncharacterized transport system substrate-binding protein
MHVKHAIHEEWQAFLSLMRFQWPLVLLFVCGVVATLYLVRPFPPAQLRIATGQPESSLEALGKQYAGIFAKNGIELELVTTAGAFENVELLKQGKVDAAFSLGGMVLEADAPGVVSLGSVEFQPFWMFYRGPRYDGSNPTVFFKDKFFSINIPGSGTRNLTEKILALHGIPVQGNNHLLSMSSAESVDAMLSGRIDGVFLVAGIESKTIQRLMADPKIHVFSFSSAQAYAKYLNFLEPLSLPRGAFSLVTDTPAQDTQIVATTTTILTTDKLHPAIQHLFLSSTKKLDYKGQSFFTRNSGFPAHIGQGIPASSVANRYFSNGPPALESYAPFWVASFLDQIWFILLATFAIAYPLLKVFPSYRSVYAHLCMTDCFDELRKVDEQCSHANSRSELQTKLDQFDSVETRINHLWIPAGARDSYYNLKNAVEITRLKTERMKEHLEAKHAR